SGNLPVEDIPHQCKISHRGIQPDIIHIQRRTRGACSVLPSYTCKNISASQHKALLVLNTDHLAKERITRLYKVLKPRLVNNVRIGGDIRNRIFLEKILTSSRNQNRQRDRYILKYFQSLHFFQSWIQHIKEKG